MLIQARGFRCTCALAVHHSAVTSAMAVGTAFGHFDHFGKDVWLFMGNCIGQSTDEHRALKERGKFKTGGKYVLVSRKYSSICLLSQHVTPHGNIFLPIQRRASSSFPNIHDL